MLGLRYDDRMDSNPARQYRNARRARAVLSRIKKMFNNHEDIEKSRNAMLDAGLYFEFDSSEIDEYIAKNVTETGYKNTLQYKDNPCDYHVFINEININNNEMLYLKIMEVRNERGIITNLEVVSFHPADG